MAPCTARAYPAHSPRGCTAISRGGYWSRRALGLGCTEGELRPKVGFGPSGILIYPPVTVVFLLLLALLLPPGEGLADRSKRVRGSGGARSPRQQAEGGGDGRVREESAITSQPSPPCHSHGTRDPVGSFASLVISGFY